MSKNNISKSKRAGKNLGFALFVLLIGVVFLFLNLEIIPSIYKNLIISWQMLLIVIGVWEFIKRRYIGGIFIVSIGIFFIYPTLQSIFPRYFINLYVDWSIYWPITLIVTGLMIILNRLFPKRTNLLLGKCKCRKTSKTENDILENISDTDYINNSVVFGKSSDIILSQNLKGGNATAVFGKIILDLRQAKCEEAEITIQLDAVFGDITLLVPTDWKIGMNSNNIFGRFEDNCKNTEMPNDAFKVVIQGNTVFGKIEISNS